MPLTVGDNLPDIKVKITGDREIALSDFRGRNLVLYFYPKASTPGCTQEGLDFTAAADAFAAANTAILGASRDGLKAQENFKTKQGFSFDLVSDKDEALCQLFDVIKLKKMYGKESLGVERSTFLIDSEGVLRHEWRKVSVKGHVDEVLAAAKALS
ncbi:peroxiredoxin [Thiorhodovibrio frisius]|uniref:thioredoxin-dependent peroxiredoxin n=1 Tax=Thiorhodovibrio frisius TaxID=631362 RepID=H8YXN4_9GAMM|nr:peroxiredoxin [Thiorhodovibrio frisius]EIC23210.1 Peroxiredoxin [Thiorhodovibrio frisius]WPL23713.1 Putative peroxiredoxin bcp [Thiorhodovibrio frisius]